MDYFAKIGNGNKPLTIFTKFSILDVWQGSENASGTTHMDVAWVTLQVFALESDVAVVWKLSSNLKVMSFFQLKNKLEWKTNWNLRILYTFTNQNSEPC